MRNWLTALAVLTGALFGYALAPGAARAQVGGPPFVPGQKLVLTFESGRNSQTCTVTLLREDFLGCADERRIGSEEREIWYNLRFVERIERRER